MESISSITGNIKQLWIRIDKPNNGTKFLAGIYRPPDGNPEALENLANSAMHME